jgi:hypothetical protein
MAYENLTRYTANPVLAELARRIGKQERRHFAWYFNNARERLERSERSRKLARKILEFAWTPVGMGVKRDDEVNRVFNLLFPGAEGLEIADRIDTRIGSLPGLEGFRPMRGALERAHAYCIKAGIVGELPNVRSVEARLRAA